MDKLTKEEQTGLGYTKDWKVGFNYIVNKIDRCKRDMNDAEFEKEMEDMKKIPASDRIKLDRELKDYLDSLIKDSNISFTKGVDYTEEDPYPSGDPDARPVMSSSKPVVSNTPAVQSNKSTGFGAYVDYSNGKNIPQMGNNAPISLLQTKFINGKMIQYVDLNFDDDIRRRMVLYYMNEIIKWLSTDSGYKKVSRYLTIFKNKDGFETTYKILQLYIKNSKSNWYDLLSQSNEIKKFTKSQLEKFNKL
jgi:hypothetical protein